MSDLPTLESVRNAAARISDYIHHTPVLSCHSIDELAGCSLYFKCENFQRSGAFKMRGAINALLSLDQRQRDSGVITHSSGNHGGALALAAKILGIDCHVVMPGDAPDCKLQAVKDYDAEIIPCEPGMPAREAAIAEAIAERPLTLVHPFDDFHVIAGQGTAMLEFLGQTDALEAIVLPVGGGGLIAGSSIVTRALQPDLTVIGVEPEGLAEAKRSLEIGVRQPATGAKTLADGLQAGIGALNFEILQESIREIVTVTEDEIWLATRLVWERMKIVVEPSSAVPLAAILGRKLPPQASRIGIILTGGNVDFSRLCKLI